MNEPILHNTIPKLRFYYIPKFNVTIWDSRIKYIENYGFSPENHKNYKI